MRHRPAAGRITLTLTLTVLVFSSALAGGAASWEVSGEGLASGRAEGTSVTPEGELVLALELHRVLETPETTLWSLAFASDGTLLAGGGETGRVHAVSADGEARVLFEAGSGEVFALAEDAEGRVLAALSPDAAVMRLARAEGDEAELLLSLEEEYVWDMLVDPRGDLYLAAGDPGRILRLRRGGDEAELVHDPGREHVRCLALDAEGRLIAGTSDRATVLRLEGDETFVLLDGGEGEVTALAVDPGNGAIWVAVAQPAPKSAPKADEKKKDAGQSAGKAKPEPPRGGGQVLRIEPDGLTRTVWTGKSETPLSLAARGPGEVLVGTGEAGRILLVDAEGRSGLFADTSSRQVHALAVRGRRLAAALSNAAALLLSEGNAADSGTLVSRPHDAGRAALWGRVRVFARAPHGSGGLTLETRGGNTAEPDGGWTPWAEVAGDPLSGDGARVELPRTRFVQWRLTLRRARQGAPAVRSVLLRYLPANRPPEILELKVEPRGLAYRALPPPAVASGEKPVLETLVPARLEKQIGPNNKKKRSKRAFEPGVQSLSWKAADPDGDHLRYSLLVSPLGEDRWVTLAEELERDFHSFDTRALPDGRYRARLVAGDGTDNPGTRARQASRPSAPFLVDNTPPEVVGAALRSEGEGLRLTFRGVDGTGPVVRAEVSLDGGPWRPLLPEDGVGDSREELFSIDLGTEGVSAGTIVVRVFDEGDNVGTGLARPVGE
jgi:hypothetical protein